jgi:hypothetical protein
MIRCEESENGRTPFRIHIIHMVGEKIFHEDSAAWAAAGIAGTCKFCDRPQHFHLPHLSS